MAVFCVGDIHGCFDEFQELLNSVRFDPSQDLLLATGDIIGRGPKPLETLHFFMNYKDCIITVLGNHELSLLRNYSTWKALPDEDSKTKYLNQLKAPELKLILNEDNGEKIIDYIRTRPLCYYDSSRKLFLSHAGLSPEWTIAEALCYAKEVEKVLNSDLFSWFTINMFSDKPSRWSKAIKKNHSSNKVTSTNKSNFKTNVPISENEMRRYIYTVNAFTRMRFCKPNLSLDFQCKDTPEIAQNYGLTPWYLLSTGLKKDETIIFGHWAALNGDSKIQNIIALDTGCVWNGSLTMINVDYPTLRHINKAHH